jgi:hypothetical protein
MINGRIKMDSENYEVVNENIPEEIKRWNWGAFFLNWIWGVAHKTYIALLFFVPLIGFVIPFVLGIKGNEWAWKNDKWQSVDEFMKIQKKWAWAGLGIILGFTLIIIFSIGITFSSMSNMEIVDDTMSIINSNYIATSKLGTPIEKGLFISGSISISGPSGSADLAIPLEGPKGKGMVYLKSTKDMGSWNIDRLVLKIEDTEEIIELVDNR